MHMHEHGRHFSVTCFLNESAVQATLLRDVMFDFLSFFLFRNEELLKQGLEINDRLQSVLAKHDAIASGAPLPVETPRRDEIPRGEPTPQPSAPPIAKPPVEEDEDDEFAQLAKR
jgi:hypothetical protein